MFEELQPSSGQLLMRAADQVALPGPKSGHLLSMLNAFLEFMGNLGLFALRAARRTFIPPFEWRMIWQQIGEIGLRSLPIVLSSGFAVGLVLTLHTRSTLVRFGAESLIPTVQSLSFFNEIGPLVAGLLVAGRVGAGIGAELAGMRVNEEIDAVEVLSVDSFKLLVIPRIIACTLALPILTVFMDVAGIGGGFLAERSASHISLHLYLNRAFSLVGWATFIPPTLKTAVFGFIIGLASSWFGYNAIDGSLGVGRAATNSVVVSSLLIILTDVILVKAIFFLFPDSAI
jgi:phospholipid/cholesterol/gamma-HCH transport system permease protein